MKKENQHYRDLVTLWIVMVILLIFAAIAHAAPKAVITAPDQVAAGKAVFLETEGTVGEGASWKVLPTTAEPFFRTLQVYEGLDSKGLPIVKHLGIFSCTEPGTYHFVLAVAEGGEVDIAVHALTNGSPDPQPDPKPEPAPDAQTLWITIVEETASRTPEAAKVLSSKTLRDYVVKHEHHLRLVDPDVVDEDGATPGDLDEYIQLGRKAGLPHVFVTNGSGSILWEGALPGSAATLLETLKKYGGE